MMSHILKSFSRALDATPGEACFAPFGGEPEPHLDELIPGKRWDAATFPTPEKLQAALRFRHEARTALFELWDAMPESGRIGLFPPR